MCVIPAKVGTSQSLHRRYGAGHISRATWVWWRNFVGSPDAMTQQEDVFETPTEPTVELRGFNMFELI